MSGNTKLFKKTPIALLAIAALTGSTAVLAADVTVDQTIAGALVGAPVAYTFIAAGTPDADATLTITTADATNQFVGAITKTPTLTTDKNVVVNGAVATIASIGEDGDGKSISNLTITKGATTVTSNIYADKISLGDDLTLTAGTISGDINFTADKTLTGTASSTVKGAITTSTNNTGNITITNQGTFEKSIGSSELALNTITNTAGASVFKGNVFVSTFVNTDGATKFEGDLTVDTLTHTAGALNFDGALTAKNAVSFAAANSTLAKDATFTAGAALIDGTTLTFDGSEAQTITGAITAAADKGTLTVTNNSGVTFANNIGVLDGKADSAILALNADNATFNGTVNALTITVTDAAANSAATFNKAVNAGTAIAITASTKYDATVAFKDTVKATALNITAGTKVDTEIGDATVTLANGLDGAAKLTAAAADASAILNIEKGEITGAIDSDDTTGNTVINTTGDVTFTGAVGATNAIDTLMVSDASTATFADHVKVTAATVNGSISLDGSKTNAISTLNLTNGASILASAAGTLNTGKILVAENGTANLTITSDGTYLLKEINADTAITAEDTIDGNKFKLSASTGTLEINGNPLLKYTNTIETGSGNADDLQIVVATVAADEQAAQVVTNTGASLQTATTYVAADAAITALDTANGDTALADKLAANAASIGYSKVAEQVAIQTDMLGSTAAAATQTGSAIFNVAANRLASVRGGSQFSGIATGDMPAMNGVWARTFGNWTEQDTHDGSYGFDADTYGVAFGMDREIADDVRLGASLAYASTDVDGKGAGNFQNDIDTYQFTVYGDYTVDTYYVEGMVGYATNSNDTSHVALGSTVKADYDSDQWMARVAAGMPYMMGETMYVTPNASLAYTHLSTDNYTEKGDLSKYVQIDDVDSLVGTLDVKIHSVMNTENGGSFIPSAHAGVSYEFGDNNVSSTGNFVGQTTKFTMKSADAEEFSGVLGAGVDYTAGQWTVGAKYDASLNADSTSHNASLEARYEF